MGNSYEREPDGEPDWMLEQSKAQHPKPTPG